MNTKVKEVLDGLIQCFENGSIPEAIAYSMHPPIDGIPCMNWSRLNRMLVYIRGTIDARGMRQWNNAGRKVKKGSKCIYILVPYFYKKQKGDGEDEQVLKGFGAKPVFRVEDTEGDPLEYEAECNLPPLPLMERAQEFGLEVKGVPSGFGYYGAYFHTNNRIELATDEESVFFHELAHAAHHKLKGGMVPGQDPIQEIVAELSAAALCRIAGKGQKDTTGNHYRYIKQYCTKLNMNVHTACLRVLREVEEVLNLILATEEKAAA